MNGILSTFAITLGSEYESVIRAAAEALVPQGRLVILDFKMPSNWLCRLAPLMALITRPFAVTLDLANRHPWEPMQAYFTNVSVEEGFGGMIYIAMGEKAKSDEDVVPTRQASVTEGRSNSATSRHC